MIKIASPDRWVVILAFIDLYIHETENKRNSVPHTQKPPPPTTTTIATTTTTKNIEKKKIKLKIQFREQNTTINK